MTIHVPRQAKGTSIGGQFKATSHSEAQIMLGAPVATATFVEDRLRGLNRLDYINQSQAMEITDRLNSSRDFSIGTFLPSQTISMKVSTAIRPLTPMPPVKR